MIQFQQLAENQMLVGLVGATLTGAGLYALRQIPAKVFQGLKELFSTSLVIDSDDAAYNHLNVWLSRQKSSRNARRVMIAEAYDYQEGRWVNQITLGQGWHLFRKGRGVIFIHRHIQPPDALGKALGGGKQQRITIITLGRNQQAIRDLVRLAEAEYRGKGLVEVLFWSGGCYEVADRRPARSLDTVFIPEEQKRRIVSDLEAFVVGREAYAQKGVPWRRGYFFEGPPGTGKTSLIQALAGHIGRAVYVVNLNSVMNDSELVRAINQVGWDGVLVMEDIDALKASKSRDQSDAAAPNPFQSERQTGVTLSGLLNAIDGLTAREGRILFITSNHPDALDPALVRPGRVDVREHIGLLGESEAKAMLQAYRPEATQEQFERNIKPRLPMSPAALQGLLLMAASSEQPANDDQPQESAA